MNLPSYKDFTAQKMKFSIKDFFSKCDQICRKLGITGDLVTYTEEILNVRLNFCAVFLTLHLSHFFNYHHVFA